ncbi:GNAT family N-acetyltransferase [Rhizobacter sp. J219]|jgi:GNAT superfamily N-acetyltransferase|uniref:GNAT family N-acetyltransferase n=1 Tax=Rhizobacter sp. J219 TaxID=2898430 RepID=UPI0021509618|nr:GNAT family N-acetyltransferase [Rhizobacter sp. J219]MCR5884817.1 GNAT family N-acetyltransferase [Rhizobacter sp. J219]
MPAELDVRDAKRADIRTLVDLYTAAGLDTRGPHDETEMRMNWDRMHTAAPGVRVFIFSLAGRPIGTYTLFVLPLLAHSGAPEAIVEDVAVHPEAQGQGIGRRMMEHARALAREAGCYKLALSSNQKRVEAHAFYERLGFERHGFSFGVTP